MDDISVMLNKKANYENLKYNLDVIISNLNKSIESLETPSDTIDNYYNIDSISIDKGKLKELRQDLINRRYYLQNTVRVEIKKEIEKLSKNIEGMG